MPVLMRPCKTKAGYEAIPTDESGEWDQSKRFDMEKVAKLLEENGCQILDAGVLLVASCLDMCEVTVYPSGRLILKTDDEEAAKIAAKRIYDVIMP